MAQVFAVTDAVKSLAEADAQYALSRAFSIYTVASELRSAFQVLKQLGQAIAPPPQA
jgi:hypothetical protein